jgi:hypothetical protein
MNDLDNEAQEFVSKQIVRLNVPPHLISSFTHCQQTLFRQVKLVSIKMKPTIKTPPSIQKPFTKADSRFTVSELAKVKVAAFLTSNSSHRRIEGEPIMCVSCQP